MRVKVLRENITQEVPLAGVVPRDIALLSAGDLVPGDGRIVEANDFFLNQSLLTGEPYPVEKVPGRLQDAQEIIAANNAVLLGTSVISGTATVLICRTGSDTALGEIADTLIPTAPPTAFEQGPAVSGC